MTDVESLYFEKLFQERVAKYDPATSTQDLGEELVDDVVDLLGFLERMQVSLNRDWFLYAYRDFPDKGHELWESFSEGFAYDLLNFYKFIDPADRIELARFFVYVRRAEEG